VTSRLATLACAALAAAAVLAPPAAANARGHAIAPAVRGHAVAAHAGPPRAHPARRVRARPRLPRDARALRRAKARAARRYRRSRHRGRVGAPQVRQRPSVFGGLNWQGLSETNATPPDTTGAIGLNHYVEATNDGVAVYTRAGGAQVSFAALDAFLGVPGDSVSDPQILWDDGSGRWYFAGIDVGTGSEQLLVGFSKTSDPSNLASGWCTYSIATTGFLDDFPKLGDDDGHIIVGANRFLGDNTFETAVIYAIDKPGAGATCPASPAFTRFGSSASHLTKTGGGDAFTPVPANTTDSSSGGYVVAADNRGSGSGTHIEAWHVGGPPGAPTLTQDGRIAVSAFSVPANAPQAGTLNLLDTSDARLTQAVAHTDPAIGAEAVWTQHAVDGPGGRSVVRWYELTPGALSVRQSGTVAESADFAFNGAISPTLAGSSAVIDYNTSGSSSLPRIAARSRASTTPLGQMSAAATLVLSSEALDDGSCTPAPCRWGDYAGAVPDPVNSALVWGSNEYAAETGGWTSRNFAMEVGGAGPAASFTASPATVDTAQGVSFDASSTTGSAGFPVNRYEWDLDGDGSFETDTGADPHALRSYTTPGSVTVRLRATDTAGDESVAERTVTVRNRAPTAAFTLSSGRVPVGQTVFLDGSSSSDLDGHITRYQWDLDGNGTFETDTGASAVTPSRAFASPVLLALRLRVTDDRGATGDAMKGLTVFKPGPPPPTKACLAAKARVKKLAASVRKLRGQVKRAHGARKRRLARTLARTRRNLANARVRMNTVC
jgi:YD repeat-containing protein